MNDNYKTHLSKDKKLAKLIEALPEIELKKRRGFFLYLIKSVISQQLSTKVADIIYNRFLALYDGKKPTAKDILNTPHDQLRSIGLSNSKANYVRNISEYALEYGMSDAKLYKMADEEVMEFLLPIKGVGRWTVEMQLMFALGRKDVFAVDDLGIQQAMCAIYKIENADKRAMKESMIKKAEPWKPYRTYACMYLWRYKDAGNL